MINMALNSPKSPNIDSKSTLEYQSNNNDVSSSENLLSPPYTTSSSLLHSKEFLLPNNFKYYNSHLNKAQFNTILVNCSINLLKLLYTDLNFDKLNLKFFIVEVLRRSKTSIQTLQIACYYILKLVKLKDESIKPDFPKSPKQLFLGLIIISSKFNQDCNYSFMSWLKICGCNTNNNNNNNNNDSKHTLNTKVFKNIETICLKLLNYECYLNGLKYKNWCNMLIIFGYDFIKSHDLTTSELTWESDKQLLNSKLKKWNTFLLHLNLDNLNLVKINFQNYYLSQLGRKILLQDTCSNKITSLFNNDSNKREACGENFNDFINSKKLKLNTCK